MTDVRARDGAALANLERLVREAIAKGHGHMVLAVSRPTRRRSRGALPRVEIARGLAGRWMGDLPDGRVGYIVDVEVSVAEAWLKRRGIDVSIAADRPTDDGGHR